jgi:hypothetical protein
MSAMVKSFREIALRTMSRLTNPAAASIAQRSFFAAFLEDSVLLDRAGLLVPDSQEGRLLTICHFMARWAAIHMPVLRPTAALVARLAMTDVSSVRLDEIRFPFGAHIVEIPSELGWRIGAKVPGDLLDLVWVHEYLTSPVDSPDVGKCFGGDGFLDVSTIVKIEDTRALHIEATSATDASFLRHFRARQDMTVGDIFEAEAGCDRPDAAILHAVLSVVFGLALFMAETGPGRKVTGTHTTKARRRAGLGRRDDKPDVYVIGEDIVLDDRLLEAARNMVSNRAAWRVSKRFVVRGHWRQQACGPARSERKRMWIQPFWKGPAAGEKLVRAYRVEPELEETSAASAEK